MLTGGGVDYSSGPYTATFSPGVTCVSCDVLITNDNVLEDNEEFNLFIDSTMLSTGVTVSNPGQATVTIFDDDGNNLIENL